MANSDGLRENIEQHKPKNTNSSNSEKRLSEAVAIAVKYTAKIHPNIQFFISPRVKKDSVYYNGLQNAILKTDNKNKFHIMDVIDPLVKMGMNTPVSNGMISRKRGYISQDGGWIKASFGNCWRPIFTAEIKNQGTNERRLAEGKEEQSRGNVAGDRAGANIDFFKTYQKIMGDNINPFGLFFEGCDYKEGYIKDRLYKYTYGFPLNTIYVHPQKIGNLELMPMTTFAQSDPWSVEDLSVVCLEIMDQSITYYKQKYETSPIT